MPDCPYCQGEGGHDLRDMNAQLREHLPDWALDEIPELHLEWIECPECEGTKVVTEEQRRKEIHAVAVAEVDQFLAKMKAEGRIE